MEKSLKFKILYIFMVLTFLTFALVPILWTFVLSITPEVEITKNTSQIITSHPILENYLELFNPQSEAFKTIIPAILNSVKMASLSILIGLPIATITAYSFYRYKFIGKKILFFLIIITMVIPVFTTIIPIYAFFARNSMLNNFFWTAIIYVSAFIPLTTWMIYSYLKSLPYEVIEAAMMDGASEIRVFFETILPMSRPILITGVLITFLMSWSQYQIPMLLTTTQNKKVITLVMQDFQGRYTIKYGLIAASGILTIIPPAIIAIYFRKFLVSGVTSGAMKG